MTPTRVTVVTVTYGRRWIFLSQVVEAIMKDDHVTKLIIVDNGSKNKEEVEAGVKDFGNRVVIIRHEKNMGSAGGFASGLAAARETDCDFVFLLDDDNVPEEGAISQFLGILKFFPGEKVALLGNRSNIPGSQEYFYHPPIRNIISKGSFFEVFKFSKVKSFFRILLSGGKKVAERGPFIPIVPNEGFIYGGSFLPIAAVRESPLPDKDLLLYGDDIEYSWGVIKEGYVSYLCAKPEIYDIDLTFEGSHIFGIFDSKTLAFKIYYRIRNMVRISIRNTHQSQLILFINIILWTLASFLLGVSKFGLTKTYIHRVKLILLAIYGGYNLNANPPAEAALP